VINQARSRKFTAKQSARLGAYLAAGLGAAATSSTDAAIVNINIGPSGFDLGGPNAGIPFPDYFGGRYDFPAPGLGGFYMGYQTSLGNPWAWTGLIAVFGSYFATDSAAYATPTNFALNDTIDGSSYFSSGQTSFLASVFKVEGLYSGTSPNFGPGSYMGFKTANNSFGWLEVTWDGADFEILSGAYETDPGVAILAGQGAAVPEPGTWAAAALLAGGAAFARWRKRRDEAQKEAA
jgi:hypothetical protein